MNISSTYVDAFPCTNRGLSATGSYYGGLQSKMTSEYSLSSIVNKFIDTDGFIITNPDEKDIYEKGLEFNIYGYYFKISKEGIAEIADKFKSTTSEVYAYITLKQAGANYEFTELIGTDVETKYEGLNIDTVIPTVQTNPANPVADGELPYNTLVKKLPILKKNPDSAQAATKPLVVITESRQKYKFNSYGYTTVDGGEIA